MAQDNVTKFLELKRENLKENTLKSFEPIKSFNGQLMLDLVIEEPEPTIKDLLARIEAQDKQIARLHESNKSQLRVNDSFGKFMESVSNLLQSIGKLRGK